MRKVPQSPLLKERKWGSEKWGNCPRPKTNKWQSQASKKPALNAQPVLSAVLYNSQRWDAENMGPAGRGHQVGDVEESPEPQERQDVLPKEDFLFWVSLWVLSNLIKPPYIPSPDLESRFQGPQDILETRIYCCWECKMARPLGKPFGSFSNDQT